MLTETVNGSKYKVVSVEFQKNRPRGDGDNVWLIRTQLQRLGDDWFWVQDDRYKSHRLAWVDTPERGETGYSQADVDFDGWIVDALALGEITAYVFGSAGWERFLVNLVNARGESASEYLMREKHWPMYKE